MKISTIYFLNIAITLAAVFSFSPVNAQQDLTLDKNNTRPEITRQFYQPASVFTINATHQNGYNEIRWNAGNEKDTRKYIVEYSTNGIYFQTAGEAIVEKGSYFIKHQTFEVVPMLYRLKIEDLEGRYSYSQQILLDGADVKPVKVYPTIITGNTVNIIAGLPVERINIYNGSGQQLFSKEVSGQSESITMVLPRLAKGMYWVHFTGRGWKTTEKIIVP